MLAERAHEYMTARGMHVVTTGNGNRSTAVQGDKLPVTQSYNGRVIVLGYTGAIERHLAH